VWKRLRRAHQFGRQFPAPSSTLPRYDLPNLASLDHIHERASRIRRQSPRSSFNVVSPRWPAIARFEKSLFQLVRTILR
jgi:hypothetical protein